MPEENKAVARRAFEDHFNTGNFDLAEEIFTVDYVNHDPSLPDFGSGPEAANQAARLYRDAFPDARITVEDQVAEGDRVATRWSARGTHQGELVGVDPTGNEVQITGITISRIEGSKIAEDWINYDALGMMQQIGAIPEPGEQAGS
jgi:predicted ester cyclase